MFLGLSCGMVAAACVPAADDWPAGRPQIVDVNYIDQASWSSSDLNFELSYADTDGDLGGGKLEVLVNDEAAATIQISEVFSRQVPSIPLDSKSGVIVVNVALSGLTLVSGESVLFEFALSDASGQTSNRASLALLTVVRKEE
jgi:hypothetical protein